MFIFKLVVGIFYNITIFGGLLFLPARLNRPDLKDTQTLLRLGAFPRFPSLYQGKVDGVSFLEITEFVFKLFKTIAHRNGVASPFPEQHR